MTGPQDDEAAASVSSLLGSLHIGVYDDHGSDRKHDARSAAPTLPLSDQLNLISAHIDSLEKEITNIVSSPEGKEVISTQLSQASQIQDRMHSIDNRIEHFETGQTSVPVYPSDPPEERVTPEDGPSVQKLYKQVETELASFVLAKKALHRKKIFNRLAHSLHDAVLALEQLHQYIDQGHWQTSRLIELMDHADAKCAILGIGVDEGDDRSDALSFKWLGASNSTPPPAVRQLKSRLAEAKETVDQALPVAWSHVVQVGPAHDGVASLNLKEANEVLQTTELIDLLRIKQQLESYLSSLAQSLLQGIIEPVLHVSTEPVSLWSAKTSADDAGIQWSCTQHSKSNQLQHDETMTSILAMLECLQKHLFGLSPHDQSELCFIFSKHFIPKFVPLVVTYLKKQLQNSLGASSEHAQTLQYVQTISDVAKRSYNSLHALGYLEKGLAEEAESLLDLDQNIVKHFFQHLGVLNRSKCRDLLLKELSGGWEALTIEFDVQISAEAQAHADQMVAEHEEVERIIGVGQTEGSGREEDDWDVWDNNDEKLSESRSSSHPRETQFSSRSPSAIQSKARQKKSALGGVRVVKPEDQMGSGPFPVEEDESSWGFDDDIPEPASTHNMLQKDNNRPNPPLTSHLNSPHAPIGDSAAPSSWHPPPVAHLEDFDEDIDEDAWGLTEEEKVERAAKRASMRASNAGTDLASAYRDFSAQENAKEALRELSTFEEGDEDAWGLSAEENSATQPPIQSSEQLQLIQGLPPKHDVQIDTPLSAAASNTQQDLVQPTSPEDAFDAWDLDAEPPRILTQDAVSGREISDLGGQTSTPTTLPSIAPEKDVDDDSTGLQGSEPVEEPKISSFTRESLLGETLSGNSGPKVDQRQESLLPEDDLWGLDDHEDIAGHDLGEVSDARQVHQSEISDRNTRVPSNNTQENVNLSVPEGGQVLDEEHEKTTSPQLDDNVASEKEYFEPKLAYGDESQRRRPNVETHVLQQQESKVKEHDGETESTKSPENPDDAWDLKDEIYERNEVLSGSEGAATGESGGKSSSSGEKLSDVQTDPWEEVIGTSEQSLSAKDATAGATGALALPGTVTHVTDTSATMGHNTPMPKHTDESFSTDAKPKPDISAMNDDGGDQWSWNDEDEIQQAPRVSRSSSQQRKTQVRSPLLRTATPTRGAASPKLREATIRSASQVGSTTSTSNVSSQHASRSSSMRKTSSRSQSKEAFHDTRNQSTENVNAKVNLPKASVQKESCLISQRSISFMQLVTSVFEDIISVRQSPFSKYDPQPLVDSLRDVLDLHRALMPVGHAETLRNVPALAAQFANDCAYIARELQKLQSRWTEEVQRPPHGTVEHLSTDFFSQQAALVGLLGQRSFDAQLLVQQQMIAECMAQTQGFEATYDDARFQACERAMRQIVTITKQLSSAWKGVLSPSYYLAALGRIVNSILRRVIRDITALQDISEVEGNQLAALIKSLMSQLEDLFANPQTGASDVALHVLSWFKASYLCDILTGSLVDIEFLYFEAGALVDYTKPELLSLLRALFSDTPKRTRLIDRIQAA